MKVYTFTNEDLERMANTVKDSVLLALLEDGVITKDQQELTSKTYCVVSKTLSSISYVYKKFFSKETEEDVPRWIVARLYHDYESELRKTLNEESKS